MDSFGELKEYDTFVNAMMDLDNDRVDAVVIDSIVFYGDFNEFYFQKTLLFFESLLKKVDT